MSDARGRDAWQHTTSMLALMINQNRHSKRDRKVHPDELNPYINRTARKNDDVIHDPGNMQILKKVFVKG